jgi:peptidoglycan/LPS O-acetylase OafA/YrhL
MTPTPDIRAKALPRLPELDGLRGLAAALVLLFALREVVAPLAPAWLERLVEGGFLMADLFFVLSGFVLCRALFGLAGAGPAVGFTLRRVARLGPLRWRS